MGDIIISLDKRPESYLNENQQRLRALEVEVHNLRSELAVSNHLIQQLLSREFTCSRVGYGGDASLSGPILEALHLLMEKEFTCNYQGGDGNDNTNQLLERLLKKEFTCNCRGGDGNDNTNQLLERLLKKEFTCNCRGGGGRGRGGGYDGGGETGGGRGQTESSPEPFYPKAETPGGWTFGKAARFFKSPVEEKMAAEDQKKQLRALSRGMVRVHEYISLNKVLTQYYSPSE